MKIKITAALVALMLSPGLALAMGCSGGQKNITASNCADGSSYDTASGACVPAPTT